MLEKELIVEMNWKNISPSAHFPDAAHGIKALKKAGITSYGYNNKVKRT